MKITCSLTTQLVVSLSLLCLLLLGFSYSVEAAARPILPGPGCKMIKASCTQNEECNAKCGSGFAGGICIGSHDAAASNAGEKIDVDMYGIIRLVGCCCWVRP
ncbi:hypothetical protein MKW94_003866 [Papaver nudicaule]|uniref:Uncharacterized protein n=1 Tax=Papaver nudicaule TaxID=74823 RepID=A0AA41UY49_PAPNU|nr:hypothetical protein [Papaver nudicaule]MCL7027079.1 hypothetical protein [Papaver nudicaule]